MKGSAVRVLRAALEAFLAGEERARLDRARDPGDETAPPERERGLWLASTHGRDALEEAREQAELAGDEAEWLARHLARIPYTLAMLRAERDLRKALRAARLPGDRALDLGDQLARIARADDEQARGALAREVERAVRPIALGYAAACGEAEQPLLIARPQAAERAPEPARVSPSGLLIVSATSPEGLQEPAARELPEEAWLADARGFLAQTQAAAEEAVQRCTRGLRAKPPLPWDMWLRGLRAPELDSGAGARDRWRRAAAWLRGLGFEPELNARLRAEVDRGGVLPLAAVIARSVPRDVCVAQIATDFGVASDVFAAEGVGRALGLALVHPALPPELRWPAGASVAGALGALSLQLWGEPEHLTRVQGLPASAARRVSEVACSLALLRARLLAASALAELAAAGKPEARQQALAEALGHALCCDVPESAAGLLGADRVTARARALEALAGYALHVGLRERYDSDWFRNPRCEEAIRGACAPGNRLTPEAWCAELGVSLEHAAARAAEPLA